MNMIISLSEQDFMYYQASKQTAGCLAEAEYQLGHKYHNNKGHVAITDPGIYKRLS